MGLPSSPFTCVVSSSCSWFISVSTTESVSILVEWTYIRIWGECSYPRCVRVSLAGCQGTTTWLGCASKLVIRLSYSISMIEAQDVIWMILGRHVISSKGSRFFLDRFSPIVVSIRSCRGRFSDFEEFLENYEFLTSNTHRSGHQHPLLNSAILFCPAVIDPKKHPKIRDSELFVAARIATALVACLWPPNFTRSSEVYSLTSNCVL